MQAAATGSYLATEVMTAPPQKLHLMLIEGAIRFAEKARQQRRAGEHEAACEALIRAQQIVAQILSGLNPAAAPTLVAKVAAVYVFAYRSLVEAGIARDETKLDGAIQALEAERTTWHQLCRKLAGGGSDTGDTGARLSLDA